MTKGLRHRRIGINHIRLQPRSDDLTYEGIETHPRSQRHNRLRLTRKDDLTYEGPVE